MSFLEALSYHYRQYFSSDFKNDFGNFDLPKRLLLALDRDGKTFDTSIEIFLLPSQSAKVDFVVELLKYYELLPKYVDDKKSNEKSKRFRKEGNELYCQKIDEKALEMYTYSVAYAENESVELGLAYGNRSAVLFKLKMFQECIEDIDRAYKNNYPEYLRIKLQERKKNAAELKSREEKIDSKLYYQAVPKIPLHKKNPLIESATNSVRITSDPKYGKYIEATEDIEIGEVIVVEKPAYVFLKEEQWRHCYHCSTLCYNPLPCKECTIALFCNADCRRDAEKYHKFECPILATIESLELSASTELALRILFSLGNNLKNLDGLLNDSDQVYRSGRYKEIHNMVTNEEHRKHSDLFERTVSVALVWNIVDNYTEFLKDKQPNCRKMFKELFFRLSLILPSNFMCVHELRRDFAGIYTFCNLGVGAYSFFSLFNHSCSNNVTFSDHGTFKIAYALENIRKGEQLFICYGPHYTTHSRDERQAILMEKFFYECSCVACTNDWPIASKLPIRNITMDVTRYLEKLFNADLKAARDLEPVLRRALKMLNGERICMNYQRIEDAWERCLYIFGNVRRSLN